MTSPIICFGQQPCGFFPKRFLVSKFNTARKLQQEIGGEIIFFYHDSDHDPRETRTVLRHRKTNEQAQLNFTFENRWQRKFSPLSLKRIPSGWQDKTISQLPNYIGHPLINVFKKMTAQNVADFCLDMYKEMGLIDGMKVVRSSDKSLRANACDIDDFFVDVPYENEIVRARYADGKFSLHEGGNAYVEVPPSEFTKEQISPARDSRLKWMQSIVHCTHYVAGMGELEYLNKGDAPEITFVQREEIDLSDEAYTELPEV